jgi:hypothetical protein
MTKKPFGWAFATMLLGAAAAAFASAGARAGPAEAAGATPMSCYSTLANPDCFTERSPDANERLIGAYLPTEPEAN